MNSQTKRVTLALTAMLLVVLMNLTPFPAAAQERPADRSVTYDLHRLRPADGYVRYEGSVFFLVFSPNPRQILFGYISDDQLPTRRGGAWTTNVQLGERATITLSSRRQGEITRIILPTEDYKRFIRGRKQYTGK